MKIEKLRKSHKKEIIIGGLILVSVVSALTLVTTRAKYKVTQNIKLVNGTVNYKVPDLRLVAVNISEDGNSYTNTNDIPTSGYELNKTKSICKVYDGTTSIEDAPKDNNVTIEYNNGNINILGLNKKNTRCYLYFDKKKEPTSEDTLAKLNITGVKDTTPTFRNTATTDEGIFKAEDGMYGGTSYYWRGAVTNNYVKFANKCWRIIRINGDGSIRLIYDGTTCHTNGSNSESIVTTGEYNASYNRSEYVGWTYSTGSQRTLSGTVSNIKSRTDGWFTTNITGTNAEKVSDGKFCNDRNVASGYSWSSQPSSTFYYAARGRLESAKTPTLSCPEGDVYILKAGAITADEVAYAGGVYGTANSNYYLYNGHYYWTMSPAYANSTPRAYAFIVLDYGQLDINGVQDGGSRGVRPVINLRSDVTFSSGTGTQNNPYVVS